jgi:hypothetical protein
MGGTYTQLFVHLVWATRGRAPLLEGEMERRVYAIIRGRCREAGRCSWPSGGPGTTYTSWFESPRRYPLPIW